MSTIKFIPNTNVHAKLLEPPKPEGFVSLFADKADSNGGLKIGSVNAGTSNSGHLFEVGLGGINGEFAANLTKAKQSASKYKVIHQELYDSADTDLISINANFETDDPLKFAMMLKPDLKDGFFEHDGIVFIDIFKDELVPNGNAMNYGMIYLVPPNYKNYKDNKAFLAAVENASSAIVNAVDMYNKTYAAKGNKLGLNPLQDIRMCLFSGAKYRGSADRDEVAQRNLKGLSNALSNPGTNSNGEIKLVTFENSFDKNPDGKVFQIIKNKLM